MGIVYDKDKEAEIESSIQSLDEGIAEQSKMLADFEGKDLTEGDNMAERNAAIAKHTRMVNDRTVMAQQLAEMRLVKPAAALPEVEADPEMQALEDLMRKDANGSVTFDINKMSNLQRAQWVADRDKMVQRSDVSGNADGAAAGALDPRTQPTIIDSLKAFGRGLDVISLFHTPDGNEMSWPMTDNTSQEGEFLANEGSQITTEDPKAVTTTSLTTRRVSSKFIPVSNTLRQDAIYDIVGHTTMQCARRIGRAISRKVVSGVYATDGVEGFVPIGTDVELSSNTTLAFVDDLIKLMHSIDRGYIHGEGGMGSTLMANSGLTNTTGFVGFVCSYDMLRILRTAKDSDNRPIWQPNTQIGAPSMLFGQPLIVVDEMDNFAAGKRPIAFGNFAYMQGRFAKDMTVTSFYDSGTAAGDYTSYLGLTRFGVRSTITPVSNKNPAIAVGLLPT